MLLPIPDILTPEQVARARQILDSADWVDGRITAGHQSSLAKDNMQIPEEHPAARQVGEMILARIGTKRALHLGGAATASLSALIQSLPGWSVIWHPR